MGKIEGHKISNVEPQSIAADLGLRPGDRVSALDDKPVQDIFDFQLRQLAEKVSLTVVKNDGQVLVFDIEKDEDEQLGLEFEQPLLDDCRICHNRCVFCFIDQLPQGMRNSLYMKDDDLRLSFLSGTYATLTNIRDEELDRLISYHFSPMNISVHTTDDKLRRKMMGNKQAGGILDKLRRIAAGGIDINAQIVLCPEINDQEALSKTVEDLIDLGPRLKSLAIVPVGLTRYRSVNKLYPLRPLAAAEAAAVIDQVEKWQAELLAERGSRVIYASDEIYIKAGRPLPQLADYEDFPQLENGVGMLVLMLHELEQGLADDEFLPSPPVFQARPAANGEAAAENARPGKKYFLATGTSAAPWLAQMQESLGREFQASVEFMPVKNRFFGENVTVAGLVTGQDLIDEFTSRCPVPEGQDPEAEAAPELILPANMFKADSPVMLDDVSVQDLADRLGVKVYVSPATGRGLLGTMAWLTRNQREEA